MKHSDFIKSAYTVLYHSKLEVESYVKNRFAYLINSGRFEDDIRYAVHQLLNHVLWQDREAVHMGFKKWKDETLPSRLEALKFHAENCETPCRCKMCKINKNWREIYERERPPICQ
tara:strand:+ start:40 stop:387 length:348 start_codon:yes stop_codon:yes gene_type:complete